MIFPSGNRRFDVFYQYFLQRGQFLSKDVEACYDKVMKREIPGFWLLEAHGYADEAAYEFLGRKLRKAEEISLPEAKAALFLPDPSLP